MQIATRSRSLALSLGVAAIALCAAAPAIAQEADERFEQVMEAHWQWYLEQNPAYATMLGEDVAGDELGDPSIAAYDAAVEDRKAFLGKLQAINPATLSDDNQLNYALLTQQLEDEIEAGDFPGKYILISNRGGPHLDMTGLPDLLPFFDADDFASYVARLGKMDEYIETATETIRTGIEGGWTQPCASMEGYEDSITTHIVDDAADSVFLAPFAAKPATMAQARFDELKAQASDIVETEIIPALEEFETFYRQEYQPACREIDGIGSVEGGQDYYAYLARSFTTTDATPEEIHQRGLSEVARIRAEMEKVIEAAEFDGTFEEWLNFLRTDPQFYPQTGDERMVEAARIAKKMDGEMPKLFATLPSLPYGLKEIPLDIAEKTTTAYYQPGAGDGTRAGFYFVNTTKLDTRPLYELEALTLHEAVPGHHHQIALAQQLDMPPFRRFTFFTAFVEGWGLYAESLGEEAGFYETPYTKFGQLSYEMWRACRLVVDTGIHAKGWTRQQAIDFMAENSALSMNNITTEVDRYITWPGQALAYKTGELKIKELRALAEEELGEDFDIRLFHDAVLGNGGVPLSVLEDHIKTWIEEQKS
ncbi:DUF885 domain-containing protein [Aquisalinus flavus]|uniref:DUF885 domain-containing protein n=1 Tax=Aquisalinus flavus TaxID=1526572 RepID=A0A8J2V2D1_9PROT|nr:DUF885 domain-containing protein [Aquisalinus flavus]MBD0426356.1 DUF885 domain-containing protein [Aquisalinus flavus]UNE48078.1 DUF885 domain-containing protein [Aquisalinus flavus]GGD08625.1 hypothetical protein GCM10011342_16810 [Aquisalinus flavus]